MAEISIKPVFERALLEMHCWPLNTIQQEWLPLIRSGKDCFLQAETGSGKTIACLLPVSETIDPALMHTQVLVVAPTRELALQDASIAEQLCAYSGIHTVAVIGGLEIRKQENALRSRPHMVIGTPGRLLDLLEQQKLSLDGVHTVIVDEGDMVLSTGQNETLQQILRRCPDARRICASATWHDAIGTWLHEDRIIQRTKAAVHTGIDQYVLEASDKDMALMQILQHMPVTRAIVFTAYKSTAHALAEFLQKQHIPAMDFSGYYEEAKRLHILQSFKDGEIRVLAATDAAARGLDIHGVSHIIHYELPIDQETYIHRSGRTAHQNNTGTVITLLDPLHDTDELAQNIRAASLPLTIDPEMSNDIFRTIEAEEVHTPSVTKLYIKKGRKDKIRPKDILGALCAVLPFEEIGVIEIQDHYSLVTVSSPKDGLLEKLNDITLKGRPVRIEIR